MSVYQLSCWVKTAFGSCRGTLSVYKVLQEKITSRAQNIFYNQMAEQNVVTQRSYRNEAIEFPDITRTSAHTFFQ